MFAPFSCQQDEVAVGADRDLAELEWVNPVDWEPFGELDCAPADSDRCDEALRVLVLEAIAESEALVGDPLVALDDRALVDLAGQSERDLRAATALGYRVAAELARRRPDPSGRTYEDGLSAYALDEVALATGLARGVVCTRVAEADALTGRHPKLLTALGAGLLPLPALRRVLDLTSVLTAAECAQVETRLLDRLGRPDGMPLGLMTSTQLSALPTPAVIAVSVRASTTRVGKIVKDLVLRIDPDAGCTREARAKTHRSVRIEPGTNGMSWLGLHLPDAAAWATYERINTLAHAIPDQHGDDRTMDAKRADVAVDLLLKAAADAPPAPVNLQVLLDHTRCDLSSPGHRGLVGEAGRLGAITTSTIRDLLDLTERATGATTSAHTVPQPCPGPAVHAAEGPGPYQPSDRLRNAVQARDRTCRFPGCNQPTRVCQLDHTTRYPDGPTCSCNLGDLCEHHHHLKHLAPGWTLTNHGHGRFTWTTPTGHTHEITPDRDPPDNWDDPDPPPS